MYEVEFSLSAKKQLDKLDNNTKIRIISTLERCRIRPHASIKKLIGSPYFILRIGQYRLILDIKEDKLIIFVIELGHRKNIYK